jgi:negative regulator of genetic competence, sporulation and motility
MEWIRISQNKLKIMLTAEDARHYELNCEQADYTDILTRTAFREILTDVKREAEFDASEDKVYIQMYPSKEGGCELFVTKIGLLLNEQQAPSTSQVSGKAAPRACPHSLSRVSQAPRAQGDIQDFPCLPISPRCLWRLRQYKSYPRDLFLQQAS